MYLFTLEKFVRLVIVVVFQHICTHCIARYSRLFQYALKRPPTQLTLTCSKSTKDTIEKSAKYVQS